MSDFSASDGGSGKVAHRVSSTLAFRRCARWRSAWENTWSLEFSHFGCASRHAKTSAVLPATSARWRHTTATVPHLLDSERPKSRLGVLQQGSGPGWGRRGGADGV